MMLSSTLGGLGTWRLRLQGLLISPAFNPIRYLSVNSAITSGIRKGRGFKENKRQPRSNDWSLGRNAKSTRKPSPWEGRGKVSSRSRPQSRDQGEMGDGSSINRRDAGGRRPFERNKPSPWYQEGGYDTYRLGDTPPERVEPPSMNSRQETDPNNHRRPSNTYDTGDEFTLKKKHIYGTKAQERRFGKRTSVPNVYPPRSGYAKTEDEVPDTNHSLSRKVYLVPPHHIPYSSPVAEFIYGTSAVNAAVRCGRRKLYTLYIYEESGGDVSREPKWEQQHIRPIAKYASLAGAQVKHVTGPWKHTLDKMTGKRPHNGLVLEASPLPKPPVLNFQTVLSMSNSHFLANLAPQPDEQAAVNGTDGHIPFEARRKNPKGSRYPFTLLLDGILDPGNLGAIFRSAYWFGVDAIVFSPLNSAPISSVVMKAAAGATETIPTLAIRDVNSFLTGSQSNGWKFFAADAPSATLVNDYTRKVPVMGNLDTLSSELQTAPCVLMLGGEGSGLQQKIKNRADAFVTIPGAYSDNVQDDIAGVSSLNVSVASALLCEAFLSRPPSGVTDAPFSSETPIEDTNRIF
ncbi:rRNA methyltransferase [Arthroderma uncinatum]|uniref:rRNA methyltransferase n=1 Tax=Arthroderma uncinatum TaxID=74035 RepID=UPI00144A7034|nr:rRNA methyltransferase [Arthroderma uncinatum]KAF3491761.1 rRNA methyltransferase [Arthroderma uncinatum]